MGGDGDAPCWNVNNRTIAVIGFDYDRVYMRRIIVHMPPGITEPPPARGGLKRRPL